MLAHVHVPKQFNKESSQLKIHSWGTKVVKLYRLSVMPVSYLDYMYVSSWLQLFTLGVEDSVYAIYGNLCDVFLLVL